jgi:hypothetical protein
MKLNDILTESQLDEFIPLTKQGRMIRRAEKAGAADLQATANKLLQQYAAHLGTQEKRVKTSDYNDLFDFLKTKKVDTSDIDTTPPINAKRIKAIFLAKSKQAMTPTQSSKQKSPSKEPNQPTTKASSAYMSTKNAALKLSSKEQRRLIAQLQKSVDKSAKPRKKATVVDKNFDKSQRLSQYGKVGK